mmetsp:Transcript_8406/g.20127  ORF Transcript_8406/g.20127 Transcript_8406/m.20127 type:complete len:97 (-) Transcript_8406:35-325(-)
MASLIEGTWVESRRKVIQHFSIQKNLPIGHQSSLNFSLPPVRQMVLPGLFNGEKTGSIIIQSVKSDDVKILDPTAGKTSHRLLVSCHIMDTLDNGI